MGISDRLKRVYSSENISVIEDEKTLIPTQESAVVTFKEFIFETLSQKVASIPVWGEYDFEAKRDLILNFLNSKLNNEFEDVSLSENEKLNIAEEFLKNNFGFGILDRLLARDDVSVVMVNSTGSVFVKYAYEFRKADFVLSKNELAELFLRCKTEQPVSRIRENNLSIVFLRPPVADNNIIITKIKHVSDTLTDISVKGIISDRLCEFIKWLIFNNKNILISSPDEVLAGDFLQVLLNSIDDEKRIAVFEDSHLFENNRENLSVFSLEGISEFDYDVLLDVADRLDFDYSVANIHDYNKFQKYYLRVTPMQSGLLTLVRSKNISDTVSKLTSAAVTALKCTEKQSKSRLASIYNYIIHLDSFGYKSYRISSIMEITSTKTSSLVLNELAKFVEDDYVEDLPELSDLL